jgi:F-type H+-transporting ATPase subunit gamma
MASTRDIRRRIKSVKNTRQITKAMELVAASKMKKAQQAALSGRPYANLLADVLAALANKVDASAHPFLAEREVKTRGILLITTDRGLCGPLNSNLFRLVQEIRTPAKFYSIGRKGTQFLARTSRAMVAAFQVSDRVPFSQVKVAAEFMIKQYSDRHGRGAVFAVQEHDGPASARAPRSPSSQPEGIPRPASNRHGHRPDSARG